METRLQSDRLSWGDTVFLHLEREGMPLNVASVCIFEGDIPLKDCRRSIEAKLPLMPRYFKRVVAAPFGVGLPTWEYDPDFKLRRHLREVKLSDGTEDQLKDLAGSLFSKVMDRQHPLWDITVVRGLKGPRTGVIFRLHHCLADGIAGVGILKLLFDTSPDAPRPAKTRLKFRVPRPADPLTSLTTGFVDYYSDFIKRILSAMADLLSMAERVGSNGNGGGSPSREFAQFLPEITAFTERIRFNVIYRGPQKFAWTEIPLADVKAIRHACGTSVNDVILAIVTATVRRYCERHRDPVKGKLLRIMVPVNLRESDATSDLGNRISLVPVTLPLDIQDPIKLLAAVHKRTEFLKHVHAAELVSLAGGLIGMFPNSLQGLAGPFASQLPVTPFNLVCTNVPGPQFPLYLLGHKMLSCYPYVPVGGEMAVNCAILSYNGQVYVGFSGDVQAAPDLSRMEELLQENFAELRKAAGAEPEHAEGQRKKTTSKKNRRTRKGMRAQPPSSARVGKTQRKRHGIKLRQKNQPQAAQPEARPPESVAAAETQNVEVTPTVA